MSKQWVGVIGLAVSIAALTLVWALIIVGTVRAVQYLRWSRRSKVRVIVGSALAAFALILGGWMIYGIALLLPGPSASPTTNGSGTRPRRALVSFLLFSSSVSTVDENPSQLRHAQRERPVRLVRWALAGCLFWFASVGLAEATAQEIANYPQPDQELWVQVMTWLPAFPIMLAVLVVGIGALRRANRRRLAARFSIVLLWSSLAVIFTVVPKPA